MNEIDAAEPSGRGRDIGKDLEPALRELCGALRHGWRLDNGPTQRCVDCGANPEAMKSAAAAEIEHVQRAVGDLGRGNADGQDRIDRLFRRHLQVVDRHCRGHEGNDVGDLAVIIALSAGGERRCKIRENVGNDGHYSPCRLSCVLNVVGRFIAKPPPCPPPAWVAAAWRGFHEPPRGDIYAGWPVHRRCGARGRHAGDSYHGCQDALSRLIHRAGHSVQERRRWTRKRSAIWSIGRSPRAPMGLFRSAPRARARR